MNLWNITPARAEELLAAWVRERGEPAYRASQIFPWVWSRPAARWQHATDLPRSLLEDLEREAPIPRLQLAARQTSLDGTVKFLWRLPDGLAVESVWIPQGKRRTLCISSQAGCAFGCVFCATGQMGFQRHLEPWEIAAQLRELLLEKEFGKPTNVVFMGMGEPLHNWRAVDTALTVLNDPGGFGIGARRITVSTVGVLPKLAKLAARPEQFRLAISLHAATSECRAKLMPVERKYPLNQLIPALETFARRVTFEYVMIKGVNDSIRDAEALAELAMPLGAFVNILSLHPGGAPGMAPSPPADMKNFARRLRELGVRATVRRSRGMDISAACGQLRVERDLGSASRPSTTVTSNSR